MGSRFRSGLLAIPTLLTIGLICTSARSSAQTTIFSENMGVPTGTTTIANYSTGTAPATFQNKATLTYGNGAQTNPADLRATSTSITYAGASGGGNVFFSSTAGAYGFSIEGINASGFNTLQLSYGYRKESPTLLPTFSVDYWNGTTWITIANTPGDLFNETPTTTGNWFLAKTLNLPVGAQVADLKIRFVKSGSVAIRIDDVKLTGILNPGTDTTPPAIASLAPSNGATGVPIDANLVATFNELVQAGTGTILLKKTTGDVTIPAAVSIAGSTLTIDPTASLDYGTAYNVVVPPGAIKDMANNNFGGIPNTGTWAFTTIPQDVTNPTMVSVSPTGPGVASTSTLSITFSENINPNGGDIVLRKADGTVIETIVASSFTPGFSVSGAVATITLSSPLDFAVSYYVRIAGDAFVDDSGNAYAGILAPDTTTWSFTTVDVPVLAATPYTQTFASYTSASTLPLGWSFSGAPGFTSDYRATWGNVTSNPAGGTFGGFLGNASVFGYHHTSTSGTVAPGMNQILTLRNGTGGPITNLTVTYRGRVNVLTNTRIPVYAVSIAGSIVSALSYSTADSDNSQRNASIALGSPIPAGATFQIIWNSSYATGSGSARQIGISDVFVSATATFFAPTVANLSVPVATIGAVTATAQSEVTSNGGQTISGRGFVYNLTSAGTPPLIGGPGVTTVADASPGVGAFSTSLTGLTASTGYSVRAYATNLTGTSYTPVVTFTTLAPSPNFVSSYTQAFANYIGINPAGWTALSDAVPPVQDFVGAWGINLATGGFLGSTTPGDAGVLGYRHTGNTGNLTVTLRLINATGATLSSLNIGYKGRVNDTEETRAPAWAVSVNGSPAIAGLAYSTFGNVDTDLSATVTGLNIAPGAEFSISWRSARGEGNGSSKQIGIGVVSVSIIGAPTNTLANWISGFNVGAETGANGDFDRDGLSNSVENILGSNPSVFNTGINTVSGTSSSVVFRHNRSTTPAADLTPSYEWSTNLTNWYPAGTFAGLTVSITPVTITPGGPTDLVQVTATVTSGTATKLFTRLKVTQP